MCIRDRLLVLFRRASVFSLIFHLLLPHQILTHINGAGYQDDQTLDDVKHVGCLLYTSRCSRQRPALPGAGRTGGLGLRGGAFIGHPFYPVSPQDGGGVTAALAGLFSGEKVKAGIPVICFLFHQLRGAVSKGSVQDVYKRQIRRSPQQHRQRQQPQQLRQQKQTKKRQKKLQKQLQKPPRI